MHNKNNYGYKLWIYWKIVINYAYNHKSLQALVIEMYLFYDWEKNLKIKILKSTFMKNQIFRLFFLFLFLLTFSHHSYSQDTLSLKVPLPFRITIGFGLGKGYPFQEDVDYGVGGTIEFAVMKKNTLYAIGARSLTEFNLLGSSNVYKTVSSYDFSYGKMLTGGKLFTSISAGVGLVRGKYPGKFIRNVGNTFFDNSIYEKITYTTIGIPLSVKGIWVPGHTFGIGLELYANFNSKNIFYGINLSQQVGRLNTGK